MPVLEPLFNKVAGLTACDFIKKRLRRRCFPVNIARFLRTGFFTEHLRWLLLTNNDPLSGTRLTHMQIQIQVPTMAPSSFAILRSDSFRSSDRRCSIEKRVIKKFAKLTGKQLLCTVVSL